MALYSVLDIIAQGLNGVRPSRFFFGRFTLPAAGVYCFVALHIADIRSLQWRLYPLIVAKREKGTNELYQKAAKVATNRKRHCTKNVSAPLTGSRPDCKKGSSMEKEKHK